MAESGSCSAWWLRFGSSWWFFPTHLKNMLQLDHETPGIRDEHEKIFELPPPSGGLLLLLEEIRGTIADISDMEKKTGI